MTPGDPQARGAGVCRSCGQRAPVQVLDLGSHPEANSFPRRHELGTEARWPLRVFVCERCWLLQLDASGPAEAALPGPPPYELSETMRDHAIRFLDDVLGHASALAQAPAPASALRVVELASHGAYLQPFLAVRGVDSLIIEGSPAMAADAARRGYQVLPKQLTEATASELVAESGPADVVIDNYLLAHVADPDDFAAGLRLLLRPGGVAVLELDHVLPLLVDRRFDSIRHGHFSYFGLISASDLLSRHGLSVVHVAPQAVYGGALRVVVRHADDAHGSPTPAVGKLLDDERRAGLAGLEAYRQFAIGVGGVRSAVREFLEARHADGEVVVGYGAPSRGNTLLNAAGITSELLAYTVDRSPLKHGRFLPGSHVPIHDPSRIFETRPDYVLILTWDIQGEVMDQMRDIRDWGGRFVTPIPSLTVTRAA